MGAYRFRRGTTANREMRAEFLLVKTEPKIEANDNFALAA
jgi:hypothetical protein